MLTSIALQMILFAPIYPLNIYLQCAACKATELNLYPISLSIVDIDETNTFQLKF